MSKQYVCDYNLRPRIDGTPTLVMAGSSFSKDIIDADTFDAMLKAGSIREFEAKMSEVADAVILDEKPVEDDKPLDEDPLEALKKKAKEEFGVELKHRKLETAQKAYDKLVADKKASAPKGIFNVDIEELADKSLDELDSIHADLCAENGLEAPDLFKSIEEGIEKLTSEA